MYMYRLVYVTVLLVYFALKLEMFPLVTIRYVECLGNAETLKDSVIIIVYSLTPLDTHSLNNTHH